MEDCLKLPPPPRVRVKLRQAYGKATLGVGSTPTHKHERPAFNDLGVQPADTSVRYHRKNPRVKSSSRTRREKKKNTARVVARKYHIY